MPPKRKQDTDGETITIPEPVTVGEPVEPPTDPSGVSSPGDDAAVTVEEMTEEESAVADTRWALAEATQRVRTLVDMMEAAHRPAAGPPAIYGAMWDAMRDVQGVGKHGKMDPAARMGNYAYRKYDDLKRELGAACRTHGIGLQSDIVAVVNEQRGNMQRVQVQIRYRFTSLVDGSEMQFDSLGESQDRSDKATGKAMTMALKSAMDQAFMLAAEDIDDPDASRPEPDPYGNGTMVPNDRWGANQRTFREGDPVPAGGHAVGDRREVGGQTFVKHSDGPGYPNDAPKDPADPWDQGAPPTTPPPAAQPVEDRRTPSEKAQAAADKVSQSGLTLDRWNTISEAARTMELMDIPVRTPDGQEVPLKHYLVAVSRTL